MIDRGQWVQQRTCSSPSIKYLTIRPLQNSLLTIALDCCASLTLYPELTYKINSPCNKLSETVQCVVWFKKKKGWDGVAQSSWAQHTAQGVSNSIVSGNDQNEWQDSIQSIINESHYVLERRLLAHGCNLGWGFKKEKSINRNLNVLQTALSL